jgi:Ca2+-binding RTX toxin-like protein
MLDNYFGGLSNITIDDNRLVGGGYTVYLDGRFGGGTVDDSSIRITNNQIGDGLWGNYSFYDDKPILSGNVGLGQTPVSAIAATVYTGTSGNDSLLSTANASTRNETYEGFDGNDFLQGGAGADALNGGNGSDTASYVGSATGVNVNLQTGAASGGYAAGDTFVNIENLLGSSFSDTLTGNSGVDFLNGNAGADTLIGGAGNDGYFIDNIGDVVIEAPGGGEDHVYSSVSYALGANVEHLTLTGGASVNATGNELNNWIAGNSGANTVSGGAGDDTLYGNSGDDVIDGGSGNDLVEGQGGNDRLTGGAGVDRFMFRQNAVASTGADHITDFSSGDKLLFDVTSGPTGPLNANAFRVGTTALDADDRFIYDQCSHTLYYDSDGNGSAGKVQIAVFDNGYALTAGDIQLW